MQGGGGRVDVLVVLAAGLLEPVQPRVGVVFGQTSVGLAVLRQLKKVTGYSCGGAGGFPGLGGESHLHVAVFAQHNPDHFAPEFCLVKVIDCQRCLLGLGHLN